MFGLTRLWWFVMLVCVHRVRLSASPVTTYAYYPSYASTYPAQPYQPQLAPSSNPAVRPYYALYHQNVYPGPFYTYQSIASPATSTGSGTGPMMITSASEMAPITHMDRPHDPVSTQESKTSEISKTKSSNSGPSSASLPPGIVFGRPLGGYDGYYYVPVYYPLSWLGQQNQQQAVASSTVPSYAYQPSLYSTLMAQASSPASLYNPNDFYPQSSPAYHYRVYAPSASSYRSSLFSSFLGAASSASGVGSHKDEMMPSDVTPDMNGNYKRSSKESNTRAGFKLSSTDFDGNRFNELDALLESPSTPIFKYRDPKAEAHLALEAVRQRAEAQKQFEKEVLMLDENVPESLQAFDEARAKFENVNHTPANQSEISKTASKIAPRTTFSFSNKNDNDKIIKNLRVSTGYRIESRSDQREAPSTKSVTHKIKIKETEKTKAPVMTSIEVFDIPGANRLLGLMDPPSARVKPVNITQPSLESLYQQLNSLGF